MGLTVLDYLIDLNAFDFNSNTTLAPLINKGLLAFEFGDDQLEIGFSYFGDIEKEHVNIDLNTKPRDVIADVEKIVNEQIEFVIKRHGCDDEPLAIESHGNEGEVRYVSIPLNESGTLNINANIDVQGDDDFYVLDWDLEEK